MTNPTVYLAGPVRHAHDGGHGWRDALVERFGGVNWLNPLDWYDVPADEVEIVPGDVVGDGVVGVETLVEKDKHLLAESDAVLVGYIDTRQVGTPMEVMWAFDRDLPVVIWTRDGLAADELSAWYRYHADAIVPERDQAVATVRSLVGDRDGCGGGR